MVLNIDFNLHSFGPKSYSCPCSASLVSKNPHPLWVSVGKPASRDCVTFHIVSPCRTSTLNCSFFLPQMLPLLFVSQNLKTKFSSAVGLFLCFQWVYVFLNYSVMTLIKCQLAQAEVCFPEFPFLHVSDQSGSQGRFFVTNMKHP